jgi:hypothetical protein
MSAITTMPTGSTPAPLDIGKVQNLSLLVGLVGVVLAGSAAVWNIELFFRSYLIAFCFLLSLGAGSLAIVMLQHLVGGGWGLMLRRFLESGTRTLPLLAILSIPVLVGMYLNKLYPWTEPAEIESLGNKATLYLNAPFFTIRMVIYFGVWLILAFVLNGLSRQEDATGNPVIPIRFRMISAPGLILYAITMSFAGIDLGMSLMPHWFSTMYPPLWAFGQILTAYAFSLLAMLTFSGTSPIRERLKGTDLRDLGSLQLAFIMIWAYLSFSQFLLIWTGNLKEEVPYFLSRLYDGWELVAIALLLLHFVLPFMLLLNSPIKRNPRTLATVAALILVMRFVDMFWVLAPSFYSDSPPLLALWSLLTVVGLGGIWLAFFLRQLQQMPLLPTHDYRLEGAAHHG